MLVAQSVFTAISAVAAVGMVWMMVLTKRKLRQANELVEQREHEARQG